MKHLKYFKEGGVWLPDEENDPDSVLGYKLTEDPDAVEYMEDKGESITSLEDLEKFLKKYIKFLSKDTFDPFYDPGKSRYIQLQKLGINELEFEEEDFNHKKLTFFDDDYYKPIASLRFLDNPRIFLDFKKG